MLKKCLLILLLISQVKWVEAQSTASKNFDAFVANAISLSEKAFYDARLKAAKNIVQSSYFENFTDYAPQHKIILIAQEIKIERFMNILYQTNFDLENYFKRVKALLPFVQKVEDKAVQGDYFLTYANLHRSMGNTDSALVYQKKALNIYEETGMNEKIAEVRAVQISRKHMQLLRDGKKEEILALIPEYKAEIKLSADYKYILSYNTRHLAQIHRRQTLDYKESLRLFKISLSLREEIGFKPFLPASYSSLGDVYTKMNAHASAIEMYTKSAELAKEVGFLRYQLSPILSIGDIYLNQGNKDKAGEYYAEGLKIAAKNNDVKGIDEALEKMDKIKD